MPGRGASTRALASLRTAARCCGTSRMWNSRNSAIAANSLVYNIRNRSIIPRKHCDNNPAGRAFPAWIAGVHNSTPAIRRKDLTLAAETMTAETITATAAGTWMLGDLRVNRMGFGAMRLTGTQAFHQGEPRDRDHSIAVLRRAVELGVNHIDTAAFYFSRLRSANELINRALAPYPEDLVIATKVGPGRDPSGEWWWATPQQLRGQVEENLRQLGRDHLSVVNLRLPRRLKTGSIAEHFPALADLRGAGLIRGLC